MNPIDTLHPNAPDASKGNRPSTRTFGEQSQRVLEDVNELGHTAMANATEAAGQLRARGAAAFEAGKDKAGVAKGKFDEIIGENPMKSVLIALGVGALIGYTMRRR